MNKHIQPTLDKPNFHCPLCGVLSEQTWSSNIQCHYTRKLPNGLNSSESYILQNKKTAKCSHCGNVSFWVNEKMVYPLTGNVEMANSDLPEDIKRDYNEAKDIVNISPRGAAALLRLAI